jgi:hypothetical protein
MVNMVVQAYVLANRALMVEGNLSMVKKMAIQKRNSKKYSYVARIFIN